LASGLWRSQLWSPDDIRPAAGLPALEFALFDAALGPVAAAALENHWRVSRAS